MGFVIGFVIVFVVGLGFVLWLNYYPTYVALRHHRNVNRFVKNQQAQPPKDGPAD